MKRLICATLIPSILALSLLGATAASAQSFHGGYGHGYGHGGGWHGRGNDGTLIGLGVGLFALGALAAASEHDRYYDRADYGPPPPPPAYGRGYGPGYGY